ncbi:MAG: hypothetical protein WCT04_11540 [Planctomycetota bacterium]
MKRIMIDVPNEYEKLARDFAEVLRGLAHNNVKITGIYVGTPNAERIAVPGHALSDLKAWLAHSPNWTTDGDYQDEHFLLSFMKEFVSKSPPAPSKGKSKPATKAAPTTKES